MQFKVVSALAFATLVTAQANGPSGPTILPPFPGNPLPTVRGSQCDEGRLQCCKSGQVPTGTQASAALSSLGISTGSVGGLVGLGCDRINARSCSATPLCCTDNSHGSVAVACNPVNLNV